MAIKIVTDSTQSLSTDFLREHDIRYVPLTVTFGADSFRERDELSNAEFYRRLVRSERLPTTSQPPVGEFLRVFAELTAAGHEVISIHLTARYTGTADAARLAARTLIEDRPEARIHVVDTRITSPMLDVMVAKAALAAEAGRDAAWILAQLDATVRDTHFVLLLDTLEYFEKGGRIGPAKAFLGSLLKVKPILDFRDGQAVPLTTVRTRPRAIAFFVDHLVEWAAGRRMWMAVGHAQAPAELESLRAQLVARIDAAEVYSAEVGPVIGTHAGPGAIGVALCPVASAPWE